MNNNIENKVNENVIVKGCSRCGSTSIHACPGQPIVWTEEKIAELKAVLKEYDGK